MPKEVTVFRAGNAVWLEIDGHPLPVDWIDSALVFIDTDEDLDTVTVNIKAERVHVESRPVPEPGESEVDTDGEAEEGPAQEAASEQLCVSGPT